MQASLPHRPDLQGLRAIAVLLVVLAHAKVPPFTGGYIGVDVFFVLSGFLISGLLINEYQTTGRIRFAEFYARRLKRLLPALLVMLLTITLIGHQLLASDEARGMLASLPYATTWTSNFHFAFRDHGYFDELTQRDLFLHTWSLGVEEQFYLIWPLMLLGILALRGCNASANNLRSARRKLGLLVAATLMLSVIWTQISSLQSFYFMPFRLWQFGLGAWVCLLARSPAALRNISKLSNVLVLSGLGLVLASSMLFTPILNYPGIWALPPTLGAALVIAAGTSYAPNQTLLAHPTLTWLGDRSYSIYLWHWPVLLLGEA